MRSLSQKYVGQNHKICKYCADRNSAQTVLAEENSPRFEPDNYWTTGAGCFIFICTGRCVEVSCTPRSGLWLIKALIYGPLLKEILDHWGYTSNLSNFNKMTQGTLINICHLAKWIFFFHIYYIYFYNYSNNKFGLNLKFYFQLKENLCYKKYIITQIYFCKKKNFQNIKYKRFKKISEISLFFLS